MPSKRQSLIPFPRVGKRESPVLSFHRRLLRSGAEATGDFKRRITRSSHSGAFSRRVLRDTGEQGFRRRLTRSSMEATTAPEWRVEKRQSLIPFPRTGKRSGGMTMAPGELDQVSTARLILSLQS